MSNPDAAGRLAELGLLIIAAIQRGDPHDCARMVARLDRGELEHLVLLLAASVPDELPTPGGRALVPVDVGDLVAERFHLRRAHPSRLARRAR